MSGPVLGTVVHDEPASEPSWIGDLGGIAGGAMLVAMGATYWAHRGAMDRAAERQGVNRTGLAVAATVAVPVGAMIVWFAGSDLAGRCLGHGARSAHPTDD